LLQQSASRLGIDQNLQRHRAVSLRQHDFLVTIKIGLDFLALNVNISKNVGDTSKVTINGLQEVIYAPVDTGIDDLELLLSLNSLGISRDFRFWSQHLLNE